MDDRDHLEIKYRTFTLTASGRTAMPAAVLIVALIVGGAIVVGLFRHW